MTAEIGFTLRLPTTWYEFDLWRATRSGDLARLVDARVAEHPQLQPYRGDLVEALREVARTAEAQGAVYCASMLEVEERDVLLANLMVFHLDGPQEPGRSRVETIASQVPAVAPSAESPVWRQVEIVQTDAGKAVRVQGIDGVTGDGGRTAHVVAMHTLVPVPGDQGVLDLVLTSPQVELAEPMLDLFDAVSATLAWPDN
jgi:hypothetical protein